MRIEFILRMEHIIWMADLYRKRSFVQIDFLLSIRQMPEYLYAGCHF